MAQSAIKKALGEAYLEASKRIYRYNVDKQPTFVVITTENIAQASKHAYGLAQKKKGRLPYLNDGVFHEAAIVGMDSLRAHLRRPSPHHGLRQDEPNQIVFTQRRGTYNTPFRALKIGILKYFESASGLKFDLKERQAFYSGISRHHGVGERSPDGSNEQMTVGLMQFTTTLNELTARGFGRFVKSTEIKELQKKFGTSLFFKTEGTGNQRRFTIKESVRVSLVLRSSEYNRAGDAPADWTHIVPAINEALSEYMLRELYNMPGSPSMKDYHEEKILDDVTTEITKGNSAKKVKGPKRNPRRKDKSVGINRPFKDTVKRSKAKAKPLANEGASKYNIHNIIAAINLRLHDTLMDNMTSPRLVYRTGRFASSVTANATTTAKGNISIGYNYQTHPYAVFAPGGKMYTPDRNPQTLIEASIREIASELAIGRYGVRRT